MATVLGVAIIVPIATVFLWAFAEAWRYPALLPTQWGLRFWGMTLARADVWLALRTSLALSVVVTAVSATICLPAAYAFARLDFAGKQLLLLSFLATQAFPKFGLYVAIAAIFLQLGLVGTFAGVAIIQVLNTLLFMIWILVAAFQTIDRRLEEAARDVGAGPFRTFWHVTLPQAGLGHRRRPAAELRRHLLRDRGRLADRRADGADHADPDDLADQQPAGDPVRRGAVGAALGAVLHRAAVRAQHPQRPHHRARAGSLGKWPRCSSTA